MDGGVALTADEVKGRNTWLVWTAGDDRLWDKLTLASFGRARFPEDRVFVSRSAGNARQSLGLSWRRE